MNPLCVVLVMCLPDVHALLVCAVSQHCRTSAPAIFGEAISVYSNCRGVQMQDRGGMVLRQMFEEVVHNKPKTSHVGDPLGGKRPNAQKPKPGMSTRHAVFLHMHACEMRQSPYLSQTKCVL